MIRFSPFFPNVQRLFIAILVLATAAVAFADEVSWIELQTGSRSGLATLYDHGIHGEGEIVDVLDTGLDWDSCYFAEPDHSPPPINTGTPLGGYDSANVDPSRRKVIAYDFLYSCDQFPVSPGCEHPGDPAAYDNQGHGTHAAASIAGDKGTPLVHDFGDAIATGAQLVIQDAGYIGGDFCSSRPGLGCPIIDLHPVLQQAYDQGARIQSNEWGDLQNMPFANPPPEANYTKASRDIDDFVWQHPDMVVVFNTGNAGDASGATLPSTLSAPGDAKNTIDVGGMEWGGNATNLLERFSGRGPTADGRLKPDLVGPAIVLAGDSDFNVTTGENCNTTTQIGTSWSSPSIAGATALVRQYYRDGFYPTGTALAANAFSPSAALVKATLIASAQEVPRDRGFPDVPVAPVPSFDQGFGVPQLNTVLHFEGDSQRLEVFDVPRDRGLEQGARFVKAVTAVSSAPLIVVLTWTDPPGVARAVGDPTPELVNDLDLSITDHSGAVLLGNAVLHPGQPDRLNNVEAVRVDVPSGGVYTIRVTAHSLGVGPRQDFALVINGVFTDVVARVVRGHAIHRP